MVASSLVLVAALCTLIIAAPNKLDRRTTFSVNQPVKLAGDFFDGVEAMRHAYLKHGLDLPEQYVKRDVNDKWSTADGPPGAIAETIAISESNDLEYLSPIEVGGVMMKLDFDTGSSDLWVFSDRLPEFQRKGHSFYVTSEGRPGPGGQIRQVTGTELQGYTWQIRYGDGTGASGVVFRDEVRLGPVSAPQQAVEAATQISAQFYQQHSDGLLGLGFGKTNTIKPQKQKTFFENIKGSLREPLFTVSLKKNATGTYDFGYIDQNKYQGSIQYIPINTTRGYWEYTATGYQVGNKPPVATKFQAIADTGTTLMLLPPQTVKDYYSSVPDARLVGKEGGYVYPCSAASKLPDITMAIGNANIHVPGHFVNRGLSATGSGLCYGGIQNGSPSLSIWGDVFLKSQFAIFDGREPPRLGLAHQAVQVINPNGNHDHMLRRED